MKRTFNLQIKEYNNDHVLTPSYVGDEHTTLRFVENFFGVNNGDVEWYNIDVIDE